MHFWIDKRSQCAYTGRHRVPSSLSAGVGRSRGRVGVGARKGMAAPVHRFAALDPPPRRPQRRNHGPPPMPAVHSRRHEEPSLYVEIPADPPQPTIAHIAAARSVTPDTLLRTAALGLHHSPVMAPHLKFGMLVSFALATVFLAGAKYYFDRQVSVVREGSGASGEATAVCAAVAALAGLGCALSLCRARPAPLPAIPPDRISSTAQRHLPLMQPSPHDDITLSALAAPPAPPSPSPSPPAPPSPARSEAPPPYHIAVLLPAPAAPPARPPAYHAIS